MKIGTLFCLLLLTVGVVHGQGPLYPSAAPAPTMKSLEQLDAAIVGTSNAVEAVHASVGLIDGKIAGVSNAIEQVEARIDLATVVGNEYFHHVINQSGSYYLSGNLAVTKANGILISAPNVTLDLNGFTVSRSSGTGGYGIYVSDAGDQATVRNGFISEFAYGVYSLSQGGVYLHQLTVSQCSWYGICVMGAGARIVDCMATANANTGIVTGDKSILSGCVALSNLSGAGISTGAGASLSGCVASNNRGIHGISAGAGSTLSGCSAISNEGVDSFSCGIYAQSGSVIGCTADRNSNTNSPCTSSQGVGIYAGYGLVKDCKAIGNQGDGIRVYYQSLVTGNVCLSNGKDDGDGAGIYVIGSDNRIENNNVTGNRRGIDVVQSRNLIVRNSASGNMTNYDITSGAKVGTIQNTPVGAGAWDNFEF